jgi:hypothetical protein
VVTERHRTAEAYTQLMSALTPANQSWAAAAPVLVLVAVRPTHERDEHANSHAWYDAGQAVGFLTLQATAGGLSVRQMQGFEPDAARRACGVPDRFEPAVVMAVGYAGDPSTLVREAHRTAELAARERRALGELVYEGAWGAVLGG